MRNGGRGIECPNTGAQVVSTKGASAGDDIVENQQQIANKPEATRK
jgi:hypothetical protein